MNLSTAYPAAMAANQAPSHDVRVQRGNGMLARLLQRPEQHGGGEDRKQPVRAQRPSPAGPAHDDRAQRQRPRSGQSRIAEWASTEQPARRAPTPRDSVCSNPPTIVAPADQHPAASSTATWSARSAPPGEASLAPVGHAVEQRKHDARQDRTEPKNMPRHWPAPGVTRRDHPARPVLAASPARTTHQAASAISTSGGHRRSRTPPDAASAPGPRTTRREKRGPPPEQPGRVVPTAERSRRA